MRSERSILWRDRSSSAPGKSHVELDYGWYGRLHSPTADCALRGDMSGETNENEAIR